MKKIEVEKVFEVEGHTVEEVNKKLTKLELKFCNALIRKYPKRNWVFSCEKVIEYV